MIWEGLLPCFIFFSYYVAFFPQYARKYHYSSPFEIGVIMCAIYIRYVVAMAMVTMVNIVTMVTYIERLLVTSHMSHVLFLYNMFCSFCNFHLYICFTFSIVILLQYSYFSSLLENSIETPG